MVGTFEKVCIRCEKLLPATREFFAKYQRICKACAETAAANYPKTAKLYCSKGHAYDEYSITLPTAKYPKGTQRCQICSAEAVKEFQRNHPRKFTPEQRERQRVYRQEHKKQAKQYMIEYNEENKPKLKIQKSTNYQKYKVQRLAKIKKDNAEFKEIVFTHYGNKCACCGETNYGLLTLDHKNNDGAAHRKETGIMGGVNMCRWIIRNNFPDMFQLLCWNCNCGRQYSPTGLCPHQEECNRRLVFWTNLERQREELADELAA